MFNHLLEYVVAFGPSFWLLAGLGALSALLALLAVGWPERRAFLAGSALCFVAALAWSVRLATSTIAGVFDDLFFREGDTLVRAQLRMLPQRLGLPFDRHLLVVLLASLIGLIVVPFGTLAALRPRGRQTGSIVLGVCAAALPLLALACALLIYFDAVSTSGCAPMAPVDPSPDIASMWSTLDALRTRVLQAGLLAAAVGSLAALRAARGGHVVGASGLYGALAVFVVGGGLFLATRDHAADTAAGPRRAFVGAPFKPFGAIADDWTHPDAVTPPTAERCSLVVDRDEDERVALVLTAEAELIARYDETWLEERGAEAWERRLRETIDGQRDWADLRGKPFSLPVVEAAIDRDAPLIRVLPFLEIAAAAGIDEFVVVSRRSLVAPTRTLGDVRIDKLCALGSVKLAGGFVPLDDLATWGDVAAAVAQAPGPLVLGGRHRAERPSAARVAERAYGLVEAGRFVTVPRPPPAPERHERRRMSR